MNRAYLSKLIIIKNMIDYMPNSMSFNVDWNIKREPIYRILDDEKWMNNFFETGEIMLSCFNQFRKYPDEMIGDRNEGEATIVGIDNGGNTNAVIYESGLNAYVMSTSTELTADVIKDFGGKCAIKINNPTYFALEISKKLPFVNSGLEGHCNYDKSRVHFLEKEKEKNKLFQSIDFKNDYNSHMLLNKLTLGMELFLKYDKYKHQNEYRLIWFSNNQIDTSIVISCPEAVEFCEKIYL